MKPKEKAKELFDKFHYQICNDNGISESESTILCAKQCALICCNEIMEAVKISQTDIQEYWEYWQSVKTEIETL